MTTRSPRLSSGCTRPNAPDESPFQNGPIRTLADLEEITSSWVHWDNTSRLEHRQQQPHGAATHTNPVCAKPGMLHPKRGDAMRHSRLFILLLSLPLFLFVGATSVG